MVVSTFFFFSGEILFQPKRGRKFGHFTVGIFVTFPDLRTEARVAEQHFAVQQMQPGGSPGILRRFWRFGLFLVPGEIWDPFFRGSLGGGFKDFLFSSLFGEMIQID